VSLAPTILDHAGVEAADARFEAPSLRPLVEGGDVSKWPPPQAEVRFLAIRRDDPSGKEPSYKRAVVDGRWKLIVDHVAKTRELYDVERDPGEREDVAAREPEVVARLEALLGEPESAAPPQSLPELTPDQLEALRKLGYVEE